MKGETKILFSYKGLRFDSNLLISVYCWLLLCLLNGIITLFNYHPLSFVLYLGSKFNSKSLLRPHVYTADFEIIFNPDKLNSALLSVFKYTPDFNSVVYVDVKGGFSIYHDASKFSLNQKWTHQKYGIYVYKILPDKLFEKTFVPEWCRYTPKKQQLRLKYVNMHTIESFTKLYGE